MTLSGGKTVQGALRNRQSTLRPSVLRFALLLLLKGTLRALLSIPCDGAESGTHVCRDGAPAGS